MSEPYITSFGQIMDALTWEQDYGCGEMSEAAKYVLEYLAYSDECDDPCSFKHWCTDGIDNNLKESTK